jgi:hypothetical protein
MGYRSDVKIFAANKAYDLIKERCIESGNEEAAIVISGEHKCSEVKDYDEETKIVYLAGIKRYSEWPVYKIIEGALTELNNMVEDDPDLLEDYFYKKIEIGEDNRTEESTNDFDDEFVCDFYVECKFSI